MRRKNPGIAVRASSRTGTLRANMAAHHLSFRVLSVPDKDPAGEGSYSSSPRVSSSSTCQKTTLRFTPSIIK